MKTIAISDLHGLLPEIVEPAVCDLWECPEDAILGRDLNSMEEVADLMYLAYQAGKKGEVWDRETIEYEEEEFYN